MSLLGKAAVAMWWNIRPDQRAEFGDWHSHEHFSGADEYPGVPARFALDEHARYGRVFRTLRAGEVRKHDVEGIFGQAERADSLVDEDEPHHQNMVRSQCRIEASFGGGVATSLATIRLSPQSGKEAPLRTALGHRLQELAPAAGLTGAHLLITDASKMSSPTTEQQIRGSDGAADWIVLLSGYDPEVVQK